MKPLSVVIMVFAVLFLFSFSASFAAGRNVAGASDATGQSAGSFSEVASPASSKGSTLHGVDDERFRPSTSVSKVKPEIVFQIVRESLLTYSFPGSNYFMLNLHTTEKFDPSSLNPASISVNLKYFRNGKLTGQELLKGKFVKANSDNPPTTPSTILRWKSDQTQWATQCTNSTDCYCQIDVSVYDTLLSEEGVKLDGDRDGTPGGHYYHRFFRGMSTP
ncbi:hypothetical protein OO006_11375 [Prosthecochloris sp. SCSIO W1101]|uniref:hypothetical protein n=1 Tax=Prosthecochloris sp. SCSIO W1101 TaxID=2992242 RepID=UPI00223E3960|nr:hypothetical protein [Prosthecochloris sp. SCSIO W1101]UZJ40942.1 hypothetical protein OO006_11375 [Prosthecochloris sp. SCSIO W1101]